MFRSILYPNLKPKMKQDMSLLQYGPYFLEKYNDNYKEFKNKPFPVPKIFIKKPFIKNKIIDNDLLEVNKIETKVPSLVLFLLLGLFVFFRSKDIKTI